MAFFFCLWYVKSVFIERLMKDKDIKNAMIGKVFKWMERETGFEPATSTLARSHSTTRITSYNVCYTKLLRSEEILALKDYFELLNNKAKKGEKEAYIQEHT